MKRVVKAADAAKENEFFTDAIDKAEDNFEYLIDGLTRLSRDGKDKDETVVQIVMDLNTRIDELTARVADIITEEVGE